MRHSRKEPAKWLSRGHSHRAELPTSDSHAGTSPCGFFRQSASTCAASHTCRPMRTAVKQAMLRRNLKRFLVLARFSPMANLPDVEKYSAYFDFIHVAPAPVFTGLNRLDNGMLGPVKVFCGVLVL